MDLVANNPNPESSVEGEFCFFEGVGEGGYSAEWATKKPDSRKKVSTQRAALVISCSSKCRSASRTVKRFAV